MSTTPHRAKPAKPGLLKKLCFSAAVLVAFALVSEVLVRAVHYQLRGRHTVAVYEGFRWLQGRLREGARDAAVERAMPFVAVYDAAAEHLRTDAGADLRSELQETYTRLFRELVDEVAAVDSEFLVIDYTAGGDREFGRFIAELTNRCGVDYADLTGAISHLPNEHRRLTPADSHLSRYANHLVAAALAERLDVYAGHASGRDYSGQPEVLGDLPRSYGIDSLQRRNLISMKPELGFCVIQNAQGFRMVEDLEIPKRRQRVLFLGDSFTFGDHLNNQDTIPSIVGRLRPKLETVNAGISGYTIRDQLELFSLRAKHAAPDVTVLQVCENDILELSVFVQRALGRGGETSQPSETEQRFEAEARALAEKRG